MTVLPQRTYLMIGLLIAIIYCLNLRLDVMEVDAAQYAAMSLEMQQSGEYLQVKHRGADYLDKPPLLFWLAATSFNVFGAGNISYKLPALLCLLLALWSTYQCAKLYYTKETALTAVAVLATTQAFFLMTNDVRTDGLLTGFVIFSVYQAAAFFKDRKQWRIFLVGVGIGMAMLSKGPVGAIIPAIAIGCHLLARKAWKEIFHPRWLISLLVIAIILFPMCWGLYHQFDLHPEKTVYGLQGPSGLRFFFWTQSFGRITGEIYWDNNAPWHFFLGTMQWDLMPWMILFFAACFSALKKILQETTLPEYFSICGFVIAFILLSTSQYKLPHYIFPLFPFAGILVADFIHTKVNTRTWPVVQMVILHLVFGVIAFGLVAAFPPKNITDYLIYLAFYAAAWINFFKVRSPAERVVMTSVITAIALGIFMTLQFYPSIFRYQSGSLAGRMIAADKKIHEREYVTYPQPSYSADFYSGHFLSNPTITDLDSLRPGDWIYASPEGKQEILETYPDEYKEITTLHDYHISMLKMKFVLASSRHEAIDTFVMLEKVK